MNGTIPTAKTTGALTMVEAAGAATDDGADTILEVCDNQQVLVCDRSKNLTGSAAATAGA